MQLLLCILIFILLNGTVFPQDNISPEKKVNDAFLLNRTSPRQAVKILGKPQEEKTGRLKISVVENWMKKEFGKKQYKILSFNSLEGIGKVKLTFLDEALVGIHFTIEKNIRASQLSAIYKIVFVPVFNEFGVKKNLGEFEKTTKNISVADFPRRYNLIAVTQSSVFVAKIFNGDSLSEDIKVYTGESPAHQNKTHINQMTGKAVELQILSRVLFD